MLKCAPGPLFLASIQFICFSPFPFSCLSNPKAQWCSPFYTNCPVEHNHHQDIVIVKVKWPPRVYCCSYISTDVHGLNNLFSQVEKNSYCLNVLTFFYLVTSFHYFACFCFFIRKEKLVFLKKKKHFIEIKIWVHSSRCNNSAVVCRQSIPVFLSFFSLSYLPKLNHLPLIFLLFFFIFVTDFSRWVWVCACLPPSLINNRFASGLHFQCTDGEIHFTSLSCQFGLWLFCLILSLLLLLLLPPLSSHVHLCLFLSSLLFPLVLSIYSVVACFIHCPGHRDRCLFCCNISQLAVWFTVVWWIVLLLFNFPWVCFCWPSTLLDYHQHWWWCTVVIIAWQSCIMSLPALPLR